MALHLGIDCGTQSIKAVVIDPAAGVIVATAVVSYRDELPEYRCPDGFLENADPLVRRADPRLWLAALDRLLGKLRDGGCPMGEIAGIGGCAQQHGTVYLNERFESLATADDEDAGLVERYAGAFSRAAGPIWMDASTGEECREFTAFAGERLTQVTGSPATERFAGPQVRRFAKTDPAGYAATRRIHLVSSFLCSVLVGGDAPTEPGDGSGTNLMDVARSVWDESLVAFAAPGLREKLPALSPSACVAGGLAPRFARFGLRPGTPVTTWTGDNPAALIGCGAHKPGIAVVSLGTSDTFFAALETWPENAEGHVFGNPAGGFMGLVCFRNGSLAREKVRADAGADRDFFNVTAFEKTPAGNAGRLALPWFEPEMTPRIANAGLRANFDFSAAAPEVRIRAAVEGSALSMRLHTRAFGDFRTLRVTGGASRSTGLLATLADVFGATVETISIPDAAALGSAMMAAHLAGGYDHETLAGRFSPAVGTLRHDPSAHATHRAAAPSIAALETSSPVGSLSSSQSSDIS